MRNLSLAILLAASLGISMSARAQVAYNFQAADQITISGAPVALPMDCFSANGFGQWTSSSASSGVANLLTNKLTSSVTSNAQAGILGNAGPGSGLSWSVFGENDIEKVSAASPTLLSSSELTNPSLGNVDNNFWGSNSIRPESVTPNGSHWNTAALTEVTASNIDYTATNHLSSAPASPGFVCSGGLITREKGTNPQAIQSPDPGESHCDSLLAIGYNYQLEYMFKQSYDTLRLFMEGCPFYVGNQYNSGVISWQGFTYVNASVSGWSAGGTGRWPVYLAWLKSVLYLNPDTLWYCNDVMDMITAVQHDEGAAEAICQYVLKSGKCPVFASDFQTFFNAASNGRHQMWFDSLKYNFDTANAATSSYYWPDSINADTLAHPYDSTIPSLFQDSLQILLGQQYAGVQQNQAVTGQALLSAQLIENPINKDDIDISFDMGRTALVSMTLSDILGRTVPLTYAKYQLEQPGNHDASIPAQSLPRGTYYLRISTDTGDAITLKVVKE